MLAHIYIIQQLFGKLRFESHATDNNKHNDAD